MSAVKRIIYLNGVDTGLSAWSRNGAVATMLGVLRRRGDLTVTADRLAASHTTEKGRVDFVWPPADTNAVREAAG